MITKFNEFTAAQVTAYAAWTPQADKRIHLKHLFFMVTVDDTVVTLFRGTTPYRKGTFSAGAGIDVPMDITFDRGEALSWTCSAGTVTTCLEGIEID